MAHNAQHRDSYRHDDHAQGADHHPASGNGSTISTTMHVPVFPQSSLSMSSMSSSAHRQASTPIFGAFGALSNAEANSALLDQLINSHQMTSQSPYMNNMSPALSMSPTYFTPSASQFGSPDIQGTFSPHLATPLDVGHFSPHQHAHPAQFYGHHHRVSSSTSLNSIPPTPGVNAGLGNTAFFNASPSSNAPFSAVSSPSVPASLASYPMDALTLFPSSTSYAAVHPDPMDYATSEGKPALPRLDVGATVLGEGAMAPHKGSLPQQHRENTMAHHSPHQRALFGYHTAHQLPQATTGAAFQPQFATPPHPNSLMPTANALQLDADSSTSSQELSQFSLPQHLLQQISELESPEHQREIFHRLREWTSSPDPRHHSDVDRMKLIVKIMCDWYAHRTRPTNADLMSFAEARFGISGETAVQAADSSFPLLVSPVKAKRGRRKTLEASLPAAPSSSAGQRGGPDYYVCLWPGCTKPPLQARTDRVQEETLIHLNLKTHCCGFCDKRYLRNNDLKRHVAKSHHGQTPSNLHTGPGLPSNSTAFAALQSPVESETSLRQTSTLATRTKRRNPYDRISPTSPSGVSTGVPSRSASNSPVVHRSAVGASPRSPFPHFTPIDNTTTASDPQLQSGLMSLFQPLAAASTAFPGLNLTEDAGSQSHTSVADFAQDGTSHERVNDQQGSHYYPTQYPSTTTNAQPIMGCTTQHWTPPMNPSTSRRHSVQAQLDLHPMQYDGTAAYQSQLQYGASPSQVPYILPSQSVPTTSSLQQAPQQQQQQRQQPPLGLSYSDLFPRAAASSAGSTSKAASNGRRLTKRRR